MGGVGANADLIVDLIDEGRLHPRSQAVTRSLADHIQGLSAEERKLIEAFDGNVLDSKVWLERLWNRIEALSNRDDAALRILVVLARPDEPVDGHLAGYLIGWGREKGASEREIFAAFGVRVRD